MFSWILDTNKLTKIGWLIVTVVIGIPVLILIFKLVDIYKSTTGYESTEVKLAKSRASVNTLETVINENKKVIEHKDKVIKVTEQVLTSHAKKFNNLEHKTNKILNDVSISKYKKPKKKITLVEDKLNDEVSKKEPEVIKIDKDRYEQVGTDNSKSVYDIYDTVKNIGE